MSAPGPARLVMAGLTKGYGSRAVLGPIDLALPSGALIAVMGPNGAGKSTLLGAIAGVLRHHGQVRLDGAPIRLDRGCCSYMPQRIRLPGNATVAETMALFRALAGSRPDRTTPAPGFIPDQDRRIGELSGGQAQRVALAGAVLGAPDLLLLDEPFANLDDAGRAEAARLLRAHRDGGATVLIASPAALDIAAACDLVIAVEAGRISIPSSEAAA